MRPLDNENRIDSGDNGTAVLLDRHPLWLEAVETVLADLNINVRASASAPEEALTLIDRYEPDLFMAEVEGINGDSDGFACIRRARERLPEMKIVVLSSSEDPRRIRAALLAGATVYVMKSARRDDLQSAVRQAFTHSVYLANDPVNTRRTGTRGGVPPPLTPRELEILRLLAEGRSNAQLAKVLWVTEQTIKFHLSNIYRKLGVSNRTEASHWGLINGVIGPG
jgi:two-component system, NarL family, response regulator DevR